MCIFVQYYLWSYTPSRWPLKILCGPWKGLENGCYFLYEPCSSVQLIEGRTWIWDCWIASLTGRPLRHASLLVRGSYRFFASNNCLIFLLCCRTIHQKSWSCLKTSLAGFPWLQLSIKKFLSLMVESQILQICLLSTRLIATK